MLAQAPLGTALDALLPDVLPLGALLAWLPRSASGAAVLPAVPLDDALLGAAPSHEHWRACANGDSGGDGQTTAIPNEKALAGMQMRVSARR